MKGKGIRVGAALLTVALAMPLFGLQTAAGVTNAPGPKAKPEKVRIVDFAFRPKTITIDAGDRIRWTNTGDRPHTSTSNGDVWDSGNLSPGDTFTRRFNDQGTFKYHCEIHPNMKGKIVVG